ncbi:MAG: hypothetical protein GIW94_15445 [Candidatus Eremiobacteraeota bacterium]|nr:hypothetical protein [Candidatus Eremiobacteraeota bacterium]
MVESRLAPDVSATIRRISWGAIFAGLFVALATQLLLSVLGVGIGASTIHVGSNDSASATGLGIGSAIWFFLSILAALFVGGWVAGTVAGMPRRVEGLLHGVVVWSLTTLVTVYLLTTAIGGILGGATGLLGKALGAAGTGAAAAAPAVTSAVGKQLKKNGITVDTVTGKVQTILRQTGNPKLSPQALAAQARHQSNLAKNAAKASAQNPQATHQNINELVYRFLHSTGATSRAADRQALINVVAAQQHVSKAQAARTVDGWAQEADAAKRQAQAVGAAVGQKTQQVANATAQGVSKTALGAFFLLLVGAAAAAAGGWFSTRLEFTEPRSVPSSRSSTAVVR